MAVFDVEEYAKKRKKNNQNNTTDNSGFDVESYITARKIQSGELDIKAIGEEINGRVNTWITNNNIYIQNAQKRYSNESPSYRTDASKWLSTVTTQNNNFKSEAESIKSLLNQYKDYFNEDYINSVMTALDGNLKVQGDVISASTKDLDYWSQWDTEDAYNEYMEEVKEYEKKLNFDLNAGRGEIDGLQSIINEFDELQKGINLTYNGYQGGSRGYANEQERAKLQARLDELTAAYGDYDTLKATLSEKQAYYTLAERAQKAEELASVANPKSKNYDPAFAEKSQYQSTESSKWHKGLTTKYGMGYEDLTYEYINGDEAFRAEVRENHDMWGFAYYGSDDPKSIYESEGYDHMSQEQIAIYNYYYNTEGKDKAQEYLDSIAESLRYQEGKVVASNLKGNLVGQYRFAVEAALDQFVSGIDGWFADGYTPASSTQYASSMIREDLADTGAQLPDWLGGEKGISWGQVGYDIINTGANMLPSILAGVVVEAALPTIGEGVALGGSLISASTAAKVGKGVGAFVLGASAGGNAKAEMLNLGYSMEQATSYGLMVGAAEASMEYLLGNIPGVSKGDGIFSTLGTKAATKVDNAISRVAIKLGNKGTSILRAVANGAIKVAGGALDEALEEGLQTVIEPWLKEIATSVDWEDPNIDEILYSSLLGALTSFALSGIGDVAGEVKTYKAGRTVQKVNYGVSKLQAVGSTFSADTVAYKIASEVNAQTDAYTIGRLLNEVGGTISEQNLTDIVNGLTDRGVRESDAKKIAREYQKFLNGEMNLSDEQVAILENLSPLADTLRNDIIGANTTVYQRTRAYSDLMNLAKEVTHSKKTTKKTKNAQKATTASEASVEGSEAILTAENASAEEVATESEFEASADGKTIVKETGKAVNIEEIVSNEGGNLMVKLDSGETVNAKDLAYSTAEEGLVYEMVANMGVNPQTAMALVKAYNPASGVKAQTYAMDIPLAYQYGKVGNKIGLEKLNLTPEQRYTAYVLGKSDAQVETDKASASLRESLTKAAENADAEAIASGKNQVRKGKVRFEYGAKAKGKAQKRIVTLAKVLSSAIGIDIYFYDSTIKGTPESQSNGYFNPKDNSIHLDLQNSFTDAKTIAYSMSHELVHFIKKWSPAKFKVFADFLMEQYGEHGVDTDTMLQKMMTKLGTDDVNEAYEEMVCEACEKMLLDSNATVKLAQLRAKDAGLFEKIKAHVLEILNKIRAEYKKYSPSSDEAQALDKMGDVMEKFYALFEDMAVDAAQTYQEAVSLNAESVVMSEDGTIKMQMKQYEQTGRTTLYNYLREQYGESDAKNLISTIDNIYDVLKEIKKDEALSVFSNWQDTEIELDDEGHPIFTTSINNGDYELNQDFSRVCKKRRQLDFVLNMLAEDPDFEASNLTKQDFVKINKAIKAHGFEIACALCFVDSKRFRQAEWADSFANTWNDILNSIVTDSSKLTPFNFATKNPNIADDGIEIDTSKAVTYRKWSDGKEDVKNRRTFDSFDQILSKDGDKWIEGNTNVRTIATLLRDHPELRHTFRGADIIASQGFDTIQRLAPGIRSILDGWGGSSVPKPSSNDASYDSSIINSKGYNKETAYAMGGVRMNSFSDFMAHMFFDYCQAFADLSAKELPSQAYTKELIYVRFFGRSGQKINMSGIAAIRDDALPTTASKGVSKAEAEANEKIEKMVAGLDITRLLEHLNKDIYQLTEADVEQFLDLCDYVWADESINMKHATLLQTGILYDKLSDSKIEECYELLKAGEIEEALKVAGEENVDTEYAKHCGTIVVGVSDAHIRKLLRDPNVRMVIPYHKSGLNPVIARELRIAVYNDYTPVQNTGAIRKGTKSRSNLTSEEIKKAYGLKDFAFYDWFGKTIDGKVYDGKATADKYLEWCEKGYYDESVGDYVYYTTKEKGYILASELHKKLTIEPKFNSFASEENYYKLLEDFDCYDTITGEHSAQGAVDFLRNGLPSDYKTVLMDALKAEQKVQDDFRDHLDNKGLKEEIMEIAKPKTAPKTIEGVKRQLKSVKPIEPSSDKWQRTHTTAEVKAQFPNLWDVSADESEVRNPTQISGTVKSYRKIYDFLKKTGFNGTILDASSGLGYGTRAGIDEYGFDVEDIEPYPDKSYSPKYTDYSTLNKKYDVIISNAVLNVLPQDQRDALVVKMGELLNDGGRLFVNVRGDDVKNASSKEAINEDLMEYYISKSGSYQKGFTKSELVAYLEDALGSGYTVMPTTFFGKTSAVVTKTEETLSEGFVDSTLKSFEITDLQDSIHIQRQVLSTLLDEGFFTNAEDRSRTDVNEESGMVIVTNKKGIFETFSFKNFIRLGKFKKLAKLATIRNLPDIIKHGHLVADNVDNQYDANDPNKKFAYIEYATEVDGKDIIVKLAIKKSPQKNKFWVHSIYTIENVSDFSASTDNGTEADYRTADNGDIITQEPPVVKRQLKNSSTRSLLANALETTAQNDIEKNKLAQYKSKIELIESEQAKLTEIRSKIKELSFAKGAKDTKAIKALQFEANQIANRINVYDRQLLNLESTTALKNVLQREKKLAYDKAKKEGKEALAKYREKATQTQRELMNRHTESRKKAVERRHMSDIRTKIKNFKKKLEGNLLHPTDRQYIPLNLVNAMIDVFNLIDTDTPLYKPNGELNKAQAQRDLTKEKLQALKDEYEALKTNADPMYSEEFDEVIYKYLTKLQNDFKDKSLADMSLAELEEMYEILKSIGETLQEARKVIGWGDASEVYEAGETIVAEQAEITQDRKNGKRNAVQRAKDFVIDLSLAPVRNVERMSGYREKSPLLRLFKDFERGVRKKNMFVMEAYKDFEALTTGENAKKYEEAIYSAYGDKTYTDVNGRKFSISKMQMMQTILSYERETANKMHHIEGSGFTFADLDMLRKGKLKEAVSEEYSHRVPSAVAMVQSFTEALANDKWAQDYMEATRKFFDRKAKDAINDTYITLKHRIIARDKNYIPFEVDKNFVVREISAQNDIQQTINSYGMLQDTKDGASQPLIITGLNNILDRHIDQVGNVYGLAVAIRNFNKVWNVRSVDSDFGGDPTVQAAIQRNWGLDGTKVITQAVQDLQGARPNTQSELYKKAKSGYIGATFALNLSVVTKQIGSLFSATSMLKWRSPVKMVANLIYTMANHKKISAEVDKYTASVWMRRQGLSDAELHILITQAKKPGFFKWLNKLPTIINPTKWITSMDTMVALSLWRYAKQDTAKRTNLTGEDLLKATAEFYDSVIENTQSMTDVLHRPEIQKRSDVVSEAFGMFKTDLYQTAGQLQTAFGRYMHNKTKENGIALARTVYSATMSAVWGSLMTTLFALLRYKVAQYRDDEDDELTMESWLKRQAFGFFGDIFGYIFPLAGGEFVGLIENIMYGETEDVVDSLALTAINDLYDAFITVGSAVKDGEMPSAEDWEKLVMKSLQIFGVPANNIKRTIKAIQLHAEDIANGEFFSFEAGKDKTDAQALYDAIMSGNEERIKKAEEVFDDESEIKSAIKQGLRDNDSRIKEAAKAHSNGDIRSYSKYIDTIVAEGHFDREMVESAIRAEESAFNTKINQAAEAKNKGNDEEYKKIVRELRDSYKGIYSQDDIVNLVTKAQKEQLETEDDDIEEATSIYKAKDINAAFESGDNEMALEVINDLLNVKIENYLAKAKKEAEESGKRFNERTARKEAETKAKSSLRSSMTSYWKPLYKEAYKSGNTAEQERIKKILKDSGLYGSSPEVIKTCREWRTERD